jgi:hypothetical protein
MIWADHIVNPKESKDWKEDYTRNIVRYTFINKCHSLISYNDKTCT